MVKQTLLQIPKPCSQNWEGMNVVSGGRFCNNCEKKVVDFSLMSDRQILEILNKSKGEVCGRFVNEQMNRELAVSSQQSNALIPAVLISTVLMAGTTAVRAAEKVAPAMEQDTVVPVTDDMILPEGRHPPLAGYSALSSGLVVNGSMPARRSSIIMGAVVTVTSVKIASLPKRKKWWQFWK